MQQQTHKYLNDPQTTRPVRDHVNWLTSMMYGLQGKLTGIAQGHLSKTEAKKLYSAEALRPHLLAGGKHALTISNMLGVAAEPQLANIPITVGVLANIPTNLSTTAVGEIYVATDVGHLFVWTGSAWNMLDGAGYAIFANVQPVPNAVWTQIPPAGGTANVTKPDGTGTTSTSFGAWALPTGWVGQNMYVRI